MIRKLPYITVGLICLFIFRQPGKVAAQGVTCPANAPVIERITDLNDYNQGWEISWIDRSSNEEGFRIETECDCHGQCPHSYFAPANATYFMSKKSDFWCNAVSLSVCAYKADCPDQCSPWQTASLSLAPCLKADVTFDAIVDDKDFNFYNNCLGCTALDCGPLGVRQWANECQLADFVHDGVINSLDNIFTREACGGASFCKCVEPSLPVCPGCPSPRHVDIDCGRGMFKKNISWAGVDFADGYEVKICTGAGCIPAHASNTEEFSYTTGCNYTRGQIARYQVIPIKSGCSPSCDIYINNFPTAAPTNTPTPTLRPGPRGSVRLMGRVVNSCWPPDSPSCQYFACGYGRYTYGLACGGTVSCYGAPDYTITWSQGGQSDTLSSNSCWDNLPRYTFEDVRNPIGDGDGEEVTVSIQMRSFVKLEKWHLDVSNDGGEIVHFEEGNFSTPGPNQTFAIKAYNIDNHFFNHLWFWAFTPSSAPVSPTPTPTSPILRPTFTLTPTPTSEAPGPRGDAWIQTVGGDVHAKDGFQVTVPALNLNFSESDINIGGFPGVVSYQNGGANFSPGNVSEKEWLAKSEAKASFYEDFYKLLGSPGAADDHFGGDWDGSITTGFYYSDSSLTIDDSYTLPSDQRIVILVNGNLTIEENIIVPMGNTDEQNFLAFIVKGNIEIDKDVKNIQGVYIADGQFKTGESDEQFIGEGVFMANKFDLGPGRGRDLGIDNLTEPAEKFVFRPDFLINAYPGLWTGSYLWEEVAPR